MEIDSVLLPSSTVTAIEESSVILSPDVAEIEIDIETVFPPRSIATQTEYEFPSIIFEIEIEQLRREIEILKAENRRLTKHPFGFFSIQEDDKVCLYYTGLHLDIYLLIEEVCCDVCSELPSYDGKRIEILPFRDQLLLLLMKLRLDLGFMDLSKRFGISLTSAYRIFRTILSGLHIVVFQAFADRIPSRKRIQQCLPACFNIFRNCRLVIDCTEMRCQSPSHMAEQKAVYSSYKHFTSGKCAIAILPNGAVVTCTQCYPGSTSDKAIVSHSNCLKPLDAGDLILADKGFLIHDLLPVGVSVNIPPFLTQKQFSPSQVMETRSIAKARIHIERFNARFKNYSVTNLITYSSFKYISTIIQTCVGLVNFQDALLKESALLAL